MVAIHLKPILRNIITNGLIIWNTMTEEDTFKVLKRKPLSEIMQYPKIFTTSFTEFLNEHGYTFEEYIAYVNANKKSYFYIMKNSQIQ